MDSNFLDVEFSVKGQLYKKRVELPFNVDSLATDQEKHDEIVNDVENALSSIADALVSHAENVLTIKVQTTADVAVNNEPATPVDE